MVIDQCEARVASRREARNASLLFAKRRLQEVLNEMDFLIAATESGDRRNTITDVNVHLLEAQKYLNTLSSEEN